MIQLHKYANMWNIRIREMFISKGIPKHWRLSLVQLRNIYYLLEFSLSTRGERHTIFTMLTVPSDPTTPSASHRPQNWTRLVQLQISCNCFSFSKSPRIPAHRSRAWRHSHLSHISYLGFLLWHLWLSHPPCANVNTCAQCVYLHVQYAE